MSTGPGTGQQDSGAERPADAARLANSIRASPTAAGNAGGRTALSRNLLPGRQLDLRWADRRSRTNGPKAQSPRSSHQRYLRVPAGPRCPATPMRRARAVNKYGSNSQAYAMADEAEKYIPEEPMLSKFWPKISWLASITTTPPGASVFR